MRNLKNMPLAGIIVIIAILFLFGLSVIMLISICGKYRRTAKHAADSAADGFLHALFEDYTAAYRQFGQDVNTPAIISGALNTHMSRALFCERFLNNAVSLFVTLGLFGTFLGLSLSVASLTELISFSNTSEWLSVLDSVGGGLISALSGMGVAFYTSLVGVACSIVLTILRAILSPEGCRSAMETELELWLDHRISPTLFSEHVKDDADLVKQMVTGINEAADGIGKALHETTDAMQKSLDDSRTQLTAFAGTVSAFNKGVRDFSEFDYNLRGTVERMDIATRDFAACLRQITGRSTERSE